MTDRELAPDEKVCPFCAETIKAAAIRCRFCHSDLPVETPVETSVPPTGEPAVEEAPVVDEPAPVTLPEEPEGTDDIGEEWVSTGWTPATAGAGRSWVSGTRWIAVLTVLCLLLAGALGFLVHRSRNPHLGIAPDGQVTSSSFRNAAMTAASEDAAKALSYGYKTFEADRKAAKALMTPSLAKQYDQVMDKVKAQTESTQLTLQATVLSAGLLSLTEHSARVLLFVNTSTTRVGSKKTLLDQNRVVMRLTRKDGDWTVSKMDAF